MKWDYLKLPGETSTVVDYTWKIIVSGEGGVGKSTLLHRYFYHEFRPDMSMTVGVSHLSHDIDRNGKLVRLIIWDLGGQKRFDVLHPAYVGDATAGFVFFDSTSLETLENMDKWVDLIRKKNTEDILLVMVGTKIDLILSQESLDYVFSLAEQKMAELNIQYVTATSSKANYNVEETINFLIDYLLWRESSAKQQT
ncbi:MAG: Rab family GTPase [Candidatus Hodarchaeota archaeon]